MNALESEYSFLAPTWKLPTIATPSLYSRTYGSSFLTHEPTYDLDWVRMHLQRSWNTFSIQFV